MTINLKFYHKLNFMLHPPIFQVELSNFLQFFNRFSAAINYYIMFLGKYQSYASLVHNRIVKFYSNWLKNNENLMKFNLDFLEDDIINLESSSLPRIYHIVCNYSCLDYNIMILTEFPKMVC